MRLTKRQLKRIIRETYVRLLAEEASSTIVVQLEFDGWGLFDRRGSGPYINREDFMYAQNQRGLTYGAAGEPRGFWKADQPEVKRKFEPLPKPGEPQWGPGMQEKILTRMLRSLSDKGVQWEMISGGEPPANKYVPGGGPKIALTGPESEIRGWLEMMANSQADWTAVEVGE